jgi:hypothetical protein
MRGNYVVLFGFVIGVTGTVLMYETQADIRRLGASADGRAVPAAHDVSTVNAGDPILAAECNRVPAS